MIKLYSKELVFALQTFSPVTCVSVTAINNSTKQDSTSDDVIFKCTEIAWNTDFLLCS